MYSVVITKSVILDCLLVKFIDFAKRVKVCGNHGLHRARRWEIISLNRMVINAIIERDTIRRESGTELLNAIDYPWYWSERERRDLARGEKSGTNPDSKMGFVQCTSRLAANSPSVQSRFATTRGIRPIGVIKGLSRIEFWASRFPIVKFTKDDHRQCTGTVPAAVVETREDSFAQLVENTLNQLLEST